MNVSKEEIQRRIEECKIRYNNKYEYIEIPNKMTDDISIICKEHGIFTQNFSSHYYGFVCKKCGIEKASKSRRKTHEKILEELKEIHNNYYDYSKSDFSDMDSDTIITCRIHGDFEQNCRNHKQKRGCPKCALERKKNKGRMPFEKFIEKANLRHNNRFTYRSDNYENQHSVVIINCKIHGEFPQTAWRHLINLHACSKCAKMNSYREQEVLQFVESLGYSVITNSRKIISPKELDIYIPSLNKAIEFNGIYWHYSKKLFKPGKHAKKSNICREKGIKLLHIREDLWLKNPEKIKQVILKFLEK